MFANVQMTFSALRGVLAITGNIITKTMNASKLTSVPSAKEEDTIWILVTSHAIDAPVFGIIVAIEECIYRKFTRDVIEEEKLPLENAKQDAQAALAARAAQAWSKAEIWERKIQCLHPAQKEETSRKVLKENKEERSRLEEEEEEKLTQVF